MAAINFIRSGVALHNWEIYQTYAAAPLPLYHLISGLVWGLAFTLAAILLWMRMTIAVYLISGLTIFSILVFWLERAFLQSDPSRWSNTGFIILVQSLWFIFVFASLWFIFPEKEDYLDENE